MCGFLNKSKSSPTPAVVAPAKAVAARDAYKAPTDARETVVSAPVADADGREASGRVKLGATRRRGGAAVGLTI